jgi:IclR family pca regulon transcriptional regulator
VPLFTEQRPAWRVSDAAPVRDAGCTVMAVANLAVQSRDWSSRRMVRELRPLVTDACADTSALLGHAA